MPPIAVRRRGGMLQMRHSILLSGWDFDPRTRMCPDAAPGTPLPVPIGRFLRVLTHLCLKAEIRVLAWEVPEHPDHERCRRQPWGKEHEPRQACTL